MVDGTNLSRTRGVARDRVVGPIPLNQLMHYAFGSGMKRTNPQCPFARYADDAVVRCPQAQAEAVMRFIALRPEECELTTHPEKSEVQQDDGARAAVVRSPAYAR